jgi:hypothetical protein
MIEPPYGVIWDALNSGQVVPFLGAGASMVGSKQWDSKNPECLPTGRQLAEYLAKQSALPSVDERERFDLAKVASYYSDVSGRGILRRKLREIFLRDFPHGSIHAFLAGFEGPMLIVATNYDRLLETAFAAAGRPFDVVVYPSDRLDSAGTVLWRRHEDQAFENVRPNQLDIDLTKRTVIFKMHGSVEPAGQQFDSFVITEEDYVEFLSRLSSPVGAVPSVFLDYCRERSFLFLGYSLRDWNLRVVLRNLATQVANREREALPSWAIDKYPSALERILWNRRNVNIYEMSVEEFVAKMQENSGA